MLPFVVLAAALVDLSWPFDAKTLYWPTSPSGFELKELHRGMTPGGYFYAANSFCAPEHGGTHLDAPVHFAEKGWAVDQIPVQKLVGRAVVVDVTGRTAKDRDYRVTAADIASDEKVHGAIPRGAIVLLRTGWSKRYPDRNGYFGDDKPGDAANLHFPGLAEDGARLLVQRGVSGVGIDTASIDYGPSRDFIAHQVLNGANIYMLENLARLEELPTRGSTIYALPMKIGGGSGAPVRVVAVLP